MSKYVVGIPTRGRTDQLRDTVTAVAASIHRPEAIYVVDNNDVATSCAWIKSLKGISTNVYFMPNSYTTLGPEQGHQTVLHRLATYTQPLQGIEICVRWDDDLIPEPDCIPKLVNAIEELDLVAVGGMYPRPGEIRTSGPSPQETGDGNPRHLQFFRWNGKHDILDVHHLYSSFAYMIEPALAVGGWCVDYSQLGHRGETDFTLRLYKSGYNLGVVTDAVAVHKLAKGGTRGIAPAERDKMLRHDEQMFRQRMTERGINWNY